MKVILHHANKPELICTELLQMIKTGRGTPAETEIRNILCRQNPDFKKKKKMDIVSVKSLTYFWWAILYRSVTAAIRCKTEHNVCKTVQAEAPKQGSTSFPSLATATSINT